MRKQEELVSSSYSIFLRRHKCLDTENEHPDIRSHTQALDASGQIDSNPMKRLKNKLISQKFKYLHKYNIKYPYINTLYRIRWIKSKRIRIHAVISSFYVEYFIKYLPA